MENSGPPPHAQPPHTPAAVVAARRAGGLARWLLRSLMLTALGLVVTLCVVFLGLSSLISFDSGSDLREEYHSLEKSAQHKVAIITLEGTILDGDGFVKKQIDRVREDDSIKAIVLRVNSPGGTVTGSDYLYHHLRKLAQEKKLPLVVSMGGIAASGGYYVSMAVGETPQVIFAEPTTWTGSIGVVIPHYTVAGLMQDWKVEEDSIKSHRLKQMGSPTKVMTDEERAIFQALVDDSFARFKEIVKSGRPAYQKQPKDLDAVATGQVFTTNQALANGLVDKEGFIEDAIARALELANLTESEAKVIRYKHLGGLFDLLNAKANSPAPENRLATFLELTAPRAYYLSTWLPPLLAR